MCSLVYDDDRLGQSSIVFIVARPSLRHGTAQHVATKCSTLIPESKIVLWCGVVWCGAVLCDVVLCTVVLCGVA